MKKNYAFAGMELQIDAPDQWMYEDALSLAPFQVNSVQDPYVFRFEKTAELPPPNGACVGSTRDLRVYADGTRYIGAVERSWEKAYAQVTCHGREYRVLVKEDQLHSRLSAWTVLNVIGTEHLAAENDAFLLHAAYIAVNGKAILFTAPSGTGKSTQADLWCCHRGAEIINGDRCAVRMQREEVLACGVPFSGSSLFCKNVTLPLAAIVYLQQAPKTTVCRLRGAEAFRRLWEGCGINNWDRADVDQVSKTLVQVLTKVPVFSLACTPDESAILALEGVLTI